MYANYYLRLYPSFAVAVARKERNVQKTAVVEGEEETSSARPPSPHKRERERERGTLGCKIQQLSYYRYREAPFFEWLDPPSLSGYSRLPQCNQLQKK